MFFVKNHCITGKKMPVSVKVLLTSNGKKRYNKHVVYECTRKMVLNTEFGGMNMDEIRLELGGYVHYGAHGVCRVDGEKMMDLGCGKKKYYLLAPVSDEHIQLYLPADADPERVRLRNVLTAEEIFQLVSQELSDQVDWVGDSKVRRELSGKTLRGGDTVELIRMVKAIHGHEANLPAGKNLPISDLEQMRSAEKQLYNEFCFVLDITKEQVLPFVLGEIQVPAKDMTKLS